MKVLHEAGVLSQSERFFSTPSAIARRLFFYVTRCGHYYCDEHYDFKDTCDISQLESHKNFFLIYLRAGFMHFIADGDKFTAEQGQLALIDCRRPHRYYTPQGAETIWIHFDGANAADFYEQIIAFHGGRHVFYPPSDSRVERELAQIVSGLKGGASIPEVAYSQRIYQILCNLLFPQHAADAADADSPTAQAMRFIGEHLFEELSVERVAAAVNLSPSHFSRRTNTSCCTASTRPRRCCTAPSCPSRRSPTGSATTARSTSSRRLPTRSGSRPPPSARRPCNPPGKGDGSGRPPFFCAAAVS